MYTNLFGVTAFARVRYTPYGVPEPVVVGDLNHDGVMNDHDRGRIAAKGIPGGCG